MKKFYRFLSLALSAVMLLGGGFAGCGKKEKNPDFTPLTVETYSFLPELQWGMSPEQAAAALGKASLTLGEVELSAGKLSSPEDGDTDHQINCAILTLKDLKLLDHAANVELWFDNPTPEPGAFSFHPEGDRSMGLVYYKVAFPLAEGENYLPLMDAVEERNLKIGGSLANPAGTTLADLPEQEVAEQTRTFLESWTNIAPIDNRYPENPLELSVAWADFNSSNSQLRVYCQGLTAAAALYVERLQGYMEEYSQENPNQVLLPTDTSG